MEEKKKRWRPSLAQYRELEKKLESQIDGTSKLVADCDGWREKYRSVIKEVSHGGDKKVLREHIEALECENRTLRHSNELMETELKRNSQVLEWNTRAMNELRGVLHSLKSRGFWSRVFNRDF